jgi:hypothetical protein
MILAPKPLSVLYTLGQATSRPVNCLFDLPTPRKRGYADSQQVLLLLALEGSMCRGRLIAIIRAKIRMVFLALFSAHGIHPGLRDLRSIPHYCKLKGFCCVSQIFSALVPPSTHGEYTLKQRTVASISQPKVSLGCDSPDQ